MVGPTVAEGCSAGTGIGAGDVGAGPPLGTPAVTRDLGVGSGVGMVGVIGGAVAGAVNPPATSCPICFASASGSRPRPALPDSSLADCLAAVSAVSRRSPTPISRATNTATTTRTRINPMRHRGVACGGPPCNGVRPLAAGDGYETKSRDSDCTAYSL